MSDGIRVDSWLWFARFFKTRGRAAAAIAAGAVRLNGVTVDKVARPVRVGDELVFSAGRRMRQVRVLALAARRGSAPQAQALYHEAEPPPCPDPDG